MISALSTRWGVSHRGVLYGIAAARPTGPDHRPTDRLAAVEGGSTCRPRGGARLLALVAILGIPLAAPALARAMLRRASVQIGSSQIVVTTPGGARAIVNRNPFGLTIVNAGGRPVLREIAAAPSPTAPLPVLGGAAAPPAGGALDPPTPVPPTSQAEFGTTGPPPPARYAPLSFLVGAQSVSETPAGQWEGTLSSVAEAGVEYSAESVLTASAQGEGVNLTLSTNDPSGRQLAVTIAPGAADTVNVSARPDPAAGVATMADSFQSGPGEAFHGFGGRHNSLDQHGNEFYNWLDQENVSSGSGDGLTATASPSRDRYMFPNGPEAAYYVQSSLVSSNGYGFLLNRDEISHWRLDSDRPDAWQVEAGAPALDYTVVAADAPQAIAQLSAITGRQPTAPSWAVGSLLDREVKYPSDPATQYQQEVLGDLANIDRYHVHLDGYRIEGWTELPRPQLAADIAALKARGIHPVLYFRAFVGSDGTGTDDPADYNYAISHGYVATHADGSPYTFFSNFNAPAAVIDFSNPAAVQWWQQRISSALDLGADGFMQDFGEQVLTGMHFHNGMTGVQMHNLLPVLYDRATRQAVDAYERTHPGRQIFFFTRAGYSGTPGDAAYESANFPGDETTDWTRSSGLAAQTTDMLNRAIGGAYGFSTDIGGYFDVGPYQATTKELFLRWAEWAALSPLFRLHGSLLAGTHTPWSYDAQTVRIYEQLIALHLAARPLILKLWHEADATGMPITRPLWLAYPNDPRATAQDQEWLLGPDVLVAPVVTDSATSRPVYFPPGCWVRPDTGVRYIGPSTVTIPAAIAELPYFFHCGTRPFAVSSPSCPAATGRVRGSTLGRLHLGEARRSVRRVFARVRTRHLHFMDFFCLTGNGVRAGYPSPHLLRALPRKERRRVRGRVVLLLSANRHYLLDGIRPGARLSAVMRRRRGTRRVRVGLNTWYLLARAPAAGVLKVVHGRVEEIGLADRRLTQTRRATQRLFHSFS
jgi:alpha-glucosidase